MQDILTRAKDALTTILAAHREPLARGGATFIGVCLTPRQLDAIKEAIQILNLPDGNDPQKGR